MSDSRQTSLSLGPSSITRRANQVSKRASKQRRRLPVLQPQLIADETFKPVETVPRTRADCPVDKPCVHVRCKYNLLREEAENRAGRPGLSSVPRDERGWTLPVSGDAGRTRPGTTLRPAWLVVRGVEVERECKVYVGRDQGGTIEMGEVRNGTLDYFLERLHVGEPVLVFCDDTGELVAKGRLRADGAFGFDRDLPDQVFASSSGVVLTRVRGVSSCALDEIEKHGQLTNEATGDAIGRHRTLVAREVKAALRKAIRTGEAMGIEREDLMAALMLIGDKGRNSNG